MSVCTEIPESAATAGSPPGACFTALMIRCNVSTMARINPIRLPCQPGAVDVGGYHSPVKLKPVLASNLKALMELRKLSQMELHRRSRVAQATIGRILREETAADVDTISALAKGLDLEPWQLLIPNIDPGNPPVLQPISTRERELYQRLRETVQDLAKAGGPKPLK